MNFKLFFFITRVYYLSFILLKRKEKGEYFPQSLKCKCLFPNVIRLKLWISFKPGYFVRVLILLSALFQEKVALDILKVSATKIFFAFSDGVSKWGSVRLECVNLKNGHFMKHLNLLFRFKWVKYLLNAWKQLLKQFKNWIFESKSYPFLYY